MGHPQSEPTPADVAAYIEDVLGELAQMASAHKLRSLSTSLRMVALEAARFAEDGEPNA